MHKTDFDVLSRAADEMGRSIAIRGSTADGYFARDGESTLVECVPPLGDLDVVLGEPKREVRSDTGIVERLRTELPACRFVHIDVVYEGGAWSGDSVVGNVVLKGLPRVEVRPDGELVETRSDNLDAEMRELVPGTLFRDFLYLLRLSWRYKGLEGAVEKVAGLLLGFDPVELGWATRSFGGGRELMRVDKALVKHVLLVEPERESIVTRLPRGWLLTFAWFLNGISRGVIWWEEQWLESTAVSYSVNGVVRSLKHDKGIDDLEWETVQEKMEQEWQVGKGRLSPLMEVGLPEAPDPGCCEYSDFSRGISELAFRDVDGGDLLDLALLEGRERVHIVHALASSGRGARSLRTDPGFMGILGAGEQRRFRMFGVRK